MNLFKRRKRASGNIPVKKIVFIREQGGTPERDFKSTIIESLRENKNVLSAYLAQVDYGNSNDFNIALCVRSNVSNNSKLQKIIGKKFSLMFNTQEHLDIIFIREDQEIELQKICRPFYEKN